jgi:hypothetical protein
VTEPLRDEQLIRDCLALLHALLACPGVQRDIVEHFQPNTQLQNVAL